MSVIQPVERLAEAVGEMVPEALDLERAWAELAEQGGEGWRRSG
jgi:hypothetical protein